jgi:hypothetical protein
MAAGGGACVVISGEIWGACACALLWRVDGKRGGVGGESSPGSADSPRQGWIANLTTGWHRCCSSECVGCHLPACLQVPARLLRLVERII